MRPWLRFVLCGLTGLLIGGGSAVLSVRSSGFASRDRIGPWTTGIDYGTAEAGAHTRAVVALRGLLALPAREARYYNAAVDDEGRPLDGRCRYVVRGGPGNGAWWSLTLYDGEGYLVANTPGIYSVAGAALPPAERSTWTINVAPDPQPGHWLPTAGLEHFDLTLRIYLPADGGRANPPRAGLPSISRVGCP